MLKKILFLLCVCFASKALTAQEFAPKSAVWYYSSTDSQWSLGRYYGVIRYSKDTVINSLTCKILQQTTFDYNKKPNGNRNYIIREDSGKVKVFMGSYFTTLYDYNLKEWRKDTAYYNDTAKINAKDSTSARFGIVVDSIRYIKVGKTKRRIFYAVILGLPISEVEYYYIEGIGGISRFTPQSLTILHKFCPCIEELRCYQDSSLSINLLGHTCDTTYKINGIEALDGGNPNLRIFPNPFSGSFRISMIENPLNNEVFNLSVYSTLGKLVYNTDLKKIEPNHEIILPQIPTGIYFLKIQSNTQILTTKILKQ